MNVVIERFAYLDNCTLGRLLAGDRMLATLEEPWLRNPKGPGGQRHLDGKESCVPDGEYKLSPHNGARFKNVYRLANPDLGVWDMPDQVPSPYYGRSAVLIHSGNTTDDIIGCILVGMLHGRLDGKHAVLRSGEALDTLRAVLGRAPHTLTIRPTAGTS